MSKTFLALLVLAAGFIAPALAQPVGAGLKVGAPFTDAVKVRSVPTFAQFSAESSHYIIGPWVEVRLPFRMAIEADALYRKYDFSNAGLPSSTNTWEFPVVLKHKLLSGPVKPYFGAGLSFSHLSDIKTVSINHLSNYGIVAEGGVELNLLLLKISPEVRYTGYGFRHFDGLVQSNRNQVAFLVGFGF